MGNRVSFNCRYCYNTVCIDKNKASPEETEYLKKIKCCDKMCKRCMNLSLSERYAIKHKLDKEFIQRRHQYLNCGRGGMAVGMPFGGVGYYPYK